MVSHLSESPVTSTPTNQLPSVRPSVPTTYIQTPWSPSEEGRRITEWELHYDSSHEQQHEMSSWHLPPRKATTVHGKFGRNWEIIMSCHTCNLPHLSIRCFRWHSSPSQLLTSSHLLTLMDGHDIYHTSHPFICQWMSHHPYIQHCSCSCGQNWNRKTLLMCALMRPCHYISPTSRPRMDQINISKTIYHWN